MSAATIRRAADLMTERAFAATPGTWQDAGEWWRSAHDGEGEVEVHYPHPTVCLADGATVVAETWNEDRADAAHIASWRPDVALEVAAWLAHEATCAERAERFEGYDERHYASALTVARVYLGSDGS